MPPVEGDYPALLWLIGFAFSAGGAWWVLLYKEKQLSAQVNELKDSTGEDDAKIVRRVEKLEDTFRDHRDEMTDRLARIETKLDSLLDRQP